VAGIGLAHHIEFFCSKIITDTKISPEQWNDSFLHWCIIIVSSNLNKKKQYLLATFNLFFSIQVKINLYFRGLLDRHDTFTVHKTR
jgi:hypothetical protein